MATFKDATSLYDLTTVSSPVLSNDETQLFYVQTSLDQAADDYQSAIMSLDLETGHETAVVANGKKNTHPVLWEQQLLYLSNKPGMAQVFRLDLETGHETQLTYSAHPVTHVQWLPGGQSFLFTTQLAKEQASPFSWPASASAKEQPNAPFYRIANLNYQANGAGFLDPNLALFLCEQDLASGRVTVLSQQSTGFGLRRVVDSDAAGTRVYFEKHLMEGDDYNHDTGLFAYDRPSGQIDAVTHAFDTGIFSEGTIAPDGRHIAMVGNPLPYETPNQFDLYLYDVAADQLTNLTTERDIQFADNSVSDFFQQVRNPLIQWHPDSHCFYVQTSEYGQVKLYRVSLTGELTQLSPEGAVVKEYTVSASGELYATISRPHQPIRLAKLVDGEWQSLLPSIELRYGDYQMATYRQVQYQAEDGGVVHGLLVLPPDFQDSKKYPLILNIHGGPYTMHALNFYHEAQYLAANGYLVLLMNPRGSYGYGQKHTYGVYERYGKEDYTDLMTAVDGVVRDFHFVDSEQLFVTGGSYGGFMTNWIITQTNRFKAAVTQRSMSNFVSMFGTSDIGYFFYKDETGHDISHADKLWEISPLAHVQQVGTPLLLIHALEDLRCQFEQAQQFYTSLRYFGKTAEMLVFPDSDHELSRTGRPSYRVERLRSMLDWFERYRM